MRCVRWLLGLWIWAAWCGAMAEASQLKPPSAADRASIIKNYPVLLKRGTLILIERHGSGKLKQITIMRWLKAPLRKVYRLIARMEDYPKLIPNVRSAKILKRHGSSGFTAKVKTAAAMISLGWVTRVRLYPPDRLEMRTISGDVRKGGWSWRLHAVGPNKSHTAVFGTYYSEVHRGSWILRWMMKKVPSMALAVNLGAGLSFMEAIQRKAENRKLSSTAGNPKRWPLRPLLGKGIQLKALKPLLKRGDLSLIESFSNGVFRQATIISRFRARSSRIYSAIRDIRKWKSWLPNVHSARIKKQSPKRIDYRLRVKILPFYSLKTRHRMKLGKNQIDMKVIGGSVKHALYRYQMHKDSSSKRSIFVYSLYVDLRSSSYFLRRIFSQNKEVEHGVTMAIGVIWLNQLRKHVEKKP